eukprot:CAMPEP_0168407600 /NCGR_PEP_ID=MMETSP0228-20121227/26244_1 /TAXON_ID=133427 /ORGANISM="Protoceratium reticulatum, Strain CCCM 535 (=CCMP 1889)" /LENGTH=47 /DNA_ID= /DNA_START= /DNA_END= /DNA_ORIENTATION=
MAFRRTRTNSYRRRSAVLALAGLVATLLSLRGGQGEASAAPGAAPVP